DVVPNVRRAVDLSYGGTRYRSALVGTTPHYVSMHAWAFEWGGMFDDADGRQGEKVCVLGASPAQRLFGSESALGHTVMIAGKFPCRVIGVLVGRGRAMSGSDLDDFVLTPVHTFELLLGMDGYAGIEVRPSMPSWLEAARV